MADESRVLVFSHADQFLFELSPADVFGRVRTEEVNGEHELEITTTRVLEKEQRVLTCDAMGKWREYVVMGVDEDHAGGLRPIGTYHCPWSLQHDLAGTVVDAMPGTKVPVAAAAALSAALGGTSRWAVGTVTQASTGGASMYYKSGWQALSIVVETWGGEVDVTIAVDSKTGVVSRRVDLYSRQGDQVAKRRFDYSRDMEGIRRKVSDDPVYCRIVPRGKGEETESGGHGRKITIESVNGGRNYLENPDAAALYRLPDGNGGWEYPTVVVENGNIEDPAELKAWGQDVLPDYTTPKVTYQADVVQLSRAGMDVHGIALGDAVQCVDRAFYEDGLRIEGRIARLVTNELDPTDNEVTIGYVSQGLAGKLADVSSIEAAVRAINGGPLTTADYLNALLERLNAEINATGGYTYITEGEGIRTYDKAVTDPLVGAEADAVVEIKGGTIRIANSRTAQGEWNWRSVFTSGHIAADVVTAAQLTSGYIGSPSGNYWNLDTGEMRMASNTTIDGKTVEEIATEAFADAVVDIQGDIEVLQNQVDGNIMTWFYDEAPAMDKPPVATDQADPTDTGWDTAKKKDAHLGDLYYNTNTGYVYRFLKDGGDYSWQRITDTDVTKALQDASVAQDTADSKRRVFITQPVPPYDIGDLWVQGQNGDIMRCTRSMKTGSYSASDWVLASKYTDDSALTAFINGAYAETIEELEGQVDGKAETWYQASDPASGWTAAQKAQHSGDLWFKTSDSTTWRYDGSKWVEQAAPKAVFDKIDGKMQVFVSQPKPPYQVGDLWFSSATSDIMTCITARKTGAYNASDWQKRNKYTDDSAVEALDEALNQQAIFNRLTNDGRLQGLYMSGGQLYINATYLKTGILTDNKGKNYWNLNTGEFSLSGYATDSELNGVKSTATSALSKANGQVGGTNLLIDSSVKGMAKHSASAGRYWSHTATNPTETWVDLGVASRPAGGVTCAIQTAIKASQKDKVSGICFYANRAVRMVSGQTYTVSCWARKTAGDAAQVRFHYGQTKYVGSKRLDITGGWKRYSWTFKFDQSRAGGSGGARVYFYAVAKTASATTVQMCGFKLEAGSKPTDWSPAPEDANYGLSKTLTDAKSYANAKAKEAKTYTDKQRKLLDDSFNQEKVLNRLTKNGKAKGIYRDKKGNLYINGTYIKSGTIDAGYIKTGLIKDTKNSNQWNLATGAMQTKDLAINKADVTGTVTCQNSDKTHVVKIANGDVVFYRGSDKAGAIETSTTGSGGGMKKGLSFVAPRGKYLKFDGNISVSDRGYNPSWSGYSGSGTALGWGQTEGISVVTGVRLVGSRIYIDKQNLNFVNGIYVGRYPSTGTNTGVFKIPSLRGV